MIRVAHPGLVLLVALLVTGAGAAPSVGALELPAAQTADEPPAEEAPGLGNIIGSPDPGPDPEDPGDRGGWAQLGLSVVLLLAVVFIGSRIVGGLRGSGP